MKYILIITATILIGDGEDPKGINLEIPYNSYDECINARKDFNLNVPFAVFKFQLQSECQVDQKDKSDGFET